MKIFDLLDINKFIQENKSRKIITNKTFKKNINGELVPNEGSFYDPAIFGFTSKEKFDKFAYIQLEDLVIHPFIYKNLPKVGTEINKCLNKKEKYIIRDGMLIKDKSGGTGVSFIINNWDKIDFKKYQKDSNELFISLLEKTKKELIIINKVPVIPIGYRNYTMNHGMVEEDEITQLYKKIMSVTDSKEWTKNLSAEEKTTIDNVFQSIYKDNSKKDYIQKYINNLYDYFINILRGKDGFFNNNLIGKRLDNVARFVINSQPDIPIDCAAVPWHALLIVFDTFIMAELNKPENIEIAKELGVDKKDIQEIGELLDYIYRNVDIYNKHFPKKENLWIKILLQVFENNPELRIITKRDPGWSQTSFWGFKPIIITGISYQMLLPSFVYKPIGGDSFYSSQIFYTYSDTIIDNKNDCIIYSHSGKKNKFIDMDKFYEIHRKNNDYPSWDEYFISSEKIKDTLKLDKNGFPIIK